MFDAHTSRQRISKQSKDTNALKSALECDRLEGLLTYRKPPVCEPLLVYYIPDKKNVKSYTNALSRLTSHTWNLWKGPNSNWEMLLLVSQDGDITEFNLKEFFDYIVENQGVSPS